MVGDELVYMKGVFSLHNLKKEEQMTVVLRLVTSPPDGSVGPWRLKDLSLFLSFMTPVSALHRSLKVCSEALGSVYILPWLQW